LSTSIPPAQARLRSGFFSSAETPHTVPFWLTNAAIVLKMNAPTGSGACCGQPEKIHEINVARGFARISQGALKDWHGLRN
jgi:hypothetical protein